MALSLPISLSTGPEGFMSENTWLFEPHRDSALPNMKDSVYCSTVGMMANVHMEYRRLSDPH